MVRLVIVPKRLSARSCGEFEARSLAYVLSSHRCARHVTTLSTMWDPGVYIREVRIQVMIDIKELVEQCWCST